ncbi:hypothetical protein [Marinobacter arenosus]|uniref:hypothetical protein n=1 Tax=Marinobacter arenosus TaxID=2856822 RepID=UPI001C4BBD42|nr:hypothetical protein [Marinobacter arenosus]MBW0147141.1 hypothetical protein [Marinobacter arenosus]
MPELKSHHHTAALGPLSHWMAYYSRRQQFRRIAKTLLAERDEILKDLGYERREILSAMNLPLRNDALKYLELHRSK